MTNPELQITKSQAKSLETRPLCDIFADIRADKLSIAEVAYIKGRLHGFDVTGVPVKVVDDHGP